jgi:hypothetical protein
MARFSCFLFVFHSAIYCTLPSFRLSAIIMSLEKGHPVSKVATTTSGARMLENQLYKNGKPRSEYLDRSTGRLGGFVITSHYKQVTIDLLSEVPPAPGFI